MNNKVRIISGSLIIVIIIIFTLFAFVYNSVETIFGPKYDKEEVVEEYKNNKALFLNVIDEILQEDDYICFDKNNGNVSIKKYSSGRIKQINVSTSTEFKKYEHTLEMIKKGMIESITKDGENIEFAISSPYGMDQYIVYLNNEEAYKFGRKVINKTKIDNMIYYIEAD